MEFIIISGLSGAGKSKAASIMEDMDFFCVDNLPAPLIPKFAELGMAGQGEYDRVVLVTDVRGGTNFDSLFRALSDLKAMKCSYRILFMEASDETIIKRYKESRRSHPLAEACDSLEQAIALERRMLAPLRERAEYIIDTSNLSTAKLKGELRRLFAKGETAQGQMDVRVISFGFKNGIPMEADLVFDARFLPNPYYVQELRPLTGLDAGVRDYVFAAPAAEESAGCCPGMRRRGRRPWSSPWAVPAGTTARWPLPTPWPERSSPWAIRCPRATGTWAGTERNSRRFCLWKGGAFL